MKKVLQDRESVDGAVILIIGNGKWFPYGKGIN